MPIHDLDNLRRSLIKPEMRPCKDRDPQIAILEHLAGKRYRTLRSIRKQQARIFTIVIPVHQHAGFIALKQENHRQERTINLV